MITVAIIAAFATFFLALVNLNGPEILCALVIVITLLERFAP
jgi:hypothetical protein